MVQRVGPSVSQVHPHDHGDRGVAAGVDSEQGTSSARRRLDAWLGAHRIAGVAALFAVLLIPCGLIVGLRERVNQPLFIIDEFAYADYLHKVHDGQLFIRRGELTGPETLRELACRGHSSDRDKPRPDARCAERTLDPTTFPNRGVNSADVHPPTYFLITDAGARTVLATQVTDNLLRAGRLFGAVWMAAGLTALWYLARLVGASRPAAAVAIAAVAGGISLQWQWHYLTPDAPNILVGSLIGLAVLRWERARSGGFLVLAGLGALALSIKAPNVLVVAAMSLYLLGRAVVASRSTASDASPLRRGRDYLLAMAALAGGGLAMAVAWLVVRRASAVSDAASDMDRHFAARELGVANFTDNLARFLGPWDAPINRTYQLSVILSYVLFGSLVAVLLGRAARRREHTLAAATVALAILGPVLLVVIIFSTSGTYFPMEARYGTSLVPLVAAVAATAWRTRTTVALLGMFVAAYHAVGLLTPIHA